VPTTSPHLEVAVLVPVKDFRRAKARLAGVVSPDERARLARWMAERVVAAARGCPVHVVCDDPDVADWAVGVGATVVWTPGVGLNGAAAAGLTALAAAGADMAVVAHSDLPLAHDLPSLATPGVVTLVPDRRRDGTNALALPATAPFRFSYGARSFTAHRREAARLGLAERVVDDEALALDVDTADDLAHPLLHEVLPAWLDRSPIRTIPASPE
jgi:2-phospho-L-lactate guanylyltransferase